MSVLSQSFYAARKPWRRHGKKQLQEELDNKHGQMHLCGKDDSLEVEETEHALVVAGTKLALLKMG